MSAKKSKKTRILYKTTETLEKICDRAEKAYWRACYALPQWTDWQRAERLRQEDRHALRQAFYLKACDLPEWQAYQDAWRSFQKRCLKRRASGTGF